MHRLLTGYSQYYNRRYRRVGQLFQDRHKSIFCQSERYLCELVRYIHLNPVRARMVKRPEDYQYSGHRAYLGLEPAGILDVDPVLRHFGGRRKIAQESYRKFVKAGMKLGHQEDFYPGEDNRILGGDEFVDATIHRIGEGARPGQQKNRTNNKYEFDASALVESVEKVCSVPREVFCGSGKTARAVRAKELLLVSGTELGASLKQLSEIVRLNSSTTSRRHAGLTPWFFPVAAISWQPFGPRSATQGVRLDLAAAQTDRGQHTSSGESEHKLFECNARKPLPKSAEFYLHCQQFR